VSEATYYKWKSKYGGMQASDIKRLRELEEENRRLKQMYAELSLDHRQLQIRRVSGFIDVRRANCRNSTRWPDGVISR